jgi:predicted dehydrogenase
VLTARIFTTFERQNVSEQPLRVGVVGLGWAGETHIKSYQQIPGVEVIAIADTHQPHLQRIGATYNIAHLFADWQELVKLPELDIVSVCTPNYLHAPVSIAALNQQKHVLCEKPLARTGDEAEAMVQAARRSGRALDVAFNHRQRGDVQVLKQYIEMGGLGNIYHAKASWMRRSGIPGMGGWFTQKETAGGGPLIDLGVHVLDMALYLLGEPKAVTVSAATYAELGPRGRGGRGGTTLISGEGGYEVEDLATAFLRFENGATLLLEASWATYGKNADDFGVSLYGTEGGADITVKNYNWENTLTIYTDTAGVPSEIHPRVTRGEGHLAVVRNFISVVRSGEWDNYHGVGGLNRTRIIDACYRSAVEGREVALS